MEQVLTSLPRPWVEVGIGSGRFAQALGIDIGLDPSRELLYIARDRGAEVLLSRGEEAPFSDGSFGAVFLIATLCFADSAEGILAEAARLLKNGGKVVLGLVLKESPWGQVYQIQKGMGHRFYRYAKFYAYSEVELFLKQTGFHIENVISTLFQTPGEVNHIEMPRQGFAVDAGFTVILAGKSAVCEKE